MFNFPWSNFHELNLDWILSVVKEAKEIFVKGAGDIQHAVETADQALETAEQAASGVIADGAVTIPKINSDVFGLFAYCVSGSVAQTAIPEGSIIILRNSTIPNVPDGIYIADRNIPQSTIITSDDLDLNTPLDSGGLNYLSDNIDLLDAKIDGLGSDDISNDSPLPGDTITDVLDYLQNRKIVMLGDSYGEQGENLTFFWELFRQHLDLTNGVNFWHAFGSGAGFGNNGYLTQLQSLTIVDKELITDIFVCGGWNDSDVSQSYGTDSAFISGVVAFKTYVESNYPNAKVTIAHISWGNPQVKPEVKTQMPVSIKRYHGLSSQGWRVLSGVEYILHRYDVNIWQNDGAHPAQVGHDVLGRYLPSAFLSGSCSIDYIGDAHTMVGLGGAWSVSPTATYENFVNGTYIVGTNSNVTLQSNGVNVATNGGISYELFGSDYIYGKGVFSANRTCVTGRVWDGSRWYNAVIEIGLKNNIFSFNLNIVKPDGTTSDVMNLIYIVVPAFNLSIPFINC